MSWVEELLDLYERNAGKAGQMMYKSYRDKKGKEQKMPYVLLPPFHTTVTAQITVTIDEDGNFLYAHTVDNEDKLTIIPVTEKSGSRTTNKEPHPLCDNLKYLAGDYKDYCEEASKDVSVCYLLYIQALEKWHLSQYTHKKVDAVYSYLVKKTLVYDLIQEGILKLDEQGCLSEKEKIQGISQTAAFVRFVVFQKRDDFGENEATSVEECWRDKTLQNSFIGYYRSLEDETGLCYLSGQKEQISYLHSKKIRDEGDGAKLISSNDDDNFTFRGRFATKEEAFSIGNESSQKVHNALKWMIRKQGRRYDSLAIVTWESDMFPVLPWDADTDAICDAAKRLIEDDAGNLPIGLEAGENPDDFGDSDESWDESAENELNVVSDGNLLGAEAFFAALDGYGKNLDNTSRMILMAFDAATTGRLALVEYKTLESSRYLENIRKWHSGCEWMHEKRKGGKRHQFRGMVSVRDIADILYGTESGGIVAIKDKNSAKLYASVSQRLIPCIWDGQNVPYDFVMRAVARASSPMAYRERLHWEQALTLACSFVKKYRQERYCEEEWTVTGLDEKCEDRNYLYGRLLAVADRVEYRTFDMEKDASRVTNAKRYMSTFSQRPFDTWKVIEENLQPYFNKLKVSERRRYENLIDTICQMFCVEDFKDNSRLDGLYLLGFHSQSYELKNFKNEKED